MSKPKVLFLCTGKRPAAKWPKCFCAPRGDHFDVYSAGLEPQEIHPLTVRVMQDAGFDLTGHHAKGLNEFLGKLHFGYLVTVCDRAHETCPVFPGVGTRIFWPFEDPAQASGTEEERLDVFRPVRDAIDDRIRHWVQDDLHLPLQTPSNPGS